MRVSDLSLSFPHIIVGSDAGIKGWFGQTYVILYSVDEWRRSPKLMHWRVLDEV